MQQSLRRSLWSLLVLAMAGCSNWTPTVEATLPLFDSGLPPQPVTAQGAIEFDDIIDVEDTGQGPVVPAQVGRQAVAVSSLTAVFQMVYTSGTAPQQNLCLSLGWFAAWGEVSSAELFGNPSNQRLILPLTFTPQGSGQWLAQGSQAYPPSALKPFEDWLNSRPADNDSATVGARGNLVRCADQSALGNDLTGQLQIDNLAAQLVLTPYLLVSSSVPAPR
jgi:hypothetical protein